MAAVGLTTRDSGLSVMETMARPWNQWYYGHPDASSQGSCSDSRSQQNEQWAPQSASPPVGFAPLQGHPSCLSRKDSLQSSHGSTSTYLGGQSPSYPTPFADSLYSSGASQRPFYNYPYPSAQLSPVISSRPETSVPRTMRMQQPWDGLTPMTNHHTFPETSRPYSITSIPSSTSGSSPPRVAAPSPGPLDNQTYTSWQEPRKTVSVRSLLNEESAVEPAATSSYKSPGKVRSDPIKYELCLRQQPVNARSCGFGDRDRRVIDPPPILQLKIHAPHLSRDVISQMLRSPLNVVHCSVWSEDGTEEMSGMPEDYTRQKRLMGNLVASPFFGEDENGDMGSFFCFPDISCRTPGKYRLKFSLVTVNPRPNAKAPVRTELLSEVFQTFTAKEFPGMSESSALAKALKSQGCNIPTKKGNEKVGRREDSDENTDDELPRRKRMRSNQ